LHADGWDSAARKSFVYPQAFTPLTKIIQARHPQVKRAVGQIGAKMEEVAKGYTCACGKFHKFNGYVYAHWNIQLVHACACGRENKIKNGVAVISNLPNKACSGLAVTSVEIDGVAQSANR
jgi:hypothetical protein